MRFKFHPGFGYTIVNTVAGFIPYFVPLCQNNPNCINGIMSLAQQLNTGKIGLGTANLQAQNIITAFFPVVDAQGGVGPIRNYADKYYPNSCGVYPCCPACPPYQCDDTQLMQDYCSRAQSRDESIDCFRNSQGVLVSRRTTDTWDYIAQQASVYKDEAAHEDSVKAQGAALKARSRVKFAEVQAASVEMRRHMDVPCMDEQNADACDDYDFSDYDLYGMNDGLSGGAWWSVFDDNPKWDPRALYVGPAGNFNLMPNSDAQAAALAKMRAEEQPYPRFNPKDWYVEEYQELLFLELLRKTCERGDVDTAINMSTLFAYRKSFLRDQWVTHVPGFIETPDSRGSAFNGRYKYQLARVVSKLPYPTQASELRLAYLISGMDLSAYQNSAGVWRYGGGGRRGSPRFIIPANSTTCEVTVALETIRLTAQFFYDVINGASMAYGLLDWQKYANMVVSYVVQAAVQSSQGKPITAPNFTKDPISGFVQDAQRIAGWTVAGMDRCILQAEYNQQHHFLTMQYADMLEAAAHDALPADLKAYLAGLKAADPNQPVRQSVNTGKLKLSSGNTLKEALAQGSGDSGSSGTLVVMGALLGLAWLFSKKE
jgi:hypothetical protein